MAVAITVAIDADEPINSPAIEVTVTGLSVGVAFTVTRTGPDGHEYVVRGMDGLPASSATEAIVDYEAPIGVPLTYEVVQGVGTDTDGPITLDNASFVFGDAWLKSVHQPALSRKVVVSEWPSTSYETRILGNFKVLGRKMPVVLTDVFGARTGEIKLVTDNDDGISELTWKELNLLLTEGKTLFFQAYGGDVTGEPDMYFELEGYSRERVGPIRSDGKQPYVHTLGFIEVDRPATSEESLGLRDYQDVLDQNSPDYQALLDNYPDPEDTYLAVLNHPPF